MKKIVWCAFGLVLAGCMSPSSPVQDYASENSISIRYSAWDSVPTLTAEARDMAAEHCAKYGKFANYQGGNAVNVLTSEEIHLFACEDTKTNDSSVVAGQSQRPSYLIL